MEYCFIVMIFIGIIFLCEPYSIVYKKHKFKFFIKCIFCFYYFKIIRKEYKPKYNKSALYNFTEIFFYYLKIFYLIISYLFLYFGIMGLCFLVVHRMIFSI